MVFLPDEFPHPESTKPQALIQKLPSVNSFRLTKKFFFFQIVRQSMFTVDTTPVGQNWNDICLSSNPSILSSINENILSKCFRTISYVQKLTIFFNYCWLISNKIGQRPYLTISFRRIRHCAEFLFFNYISSKQWTQRWLQRDGDFVSNSSCYNGYQRPIQRIH